GRVDLAALDTALARHAAAGRQALVSVMLANNETGILQPVAEAAARTAEAELATEGARLAALRDRLEAGLIACVPDAMVLGANVARLPNTVCVIFPDIKAETLVIALDLAHLSVSAGSACSSGKVGASYVLKAMGLAEQHARGAIRLSLGWSSTNEDIDAALAAIGRTVPRVRNRPERAA
ncbi:MAG: hypothetical protein B7Y12_24220, partial [Rhizobiales bacterium 24-66-13]